MLKLRRASVAYRDYRIWPAIMVDADDLRLVTAKVGDFGGRGEVVNSIANGENVFFLHAIAECHLDSFPWSTWQVRRATTLAAIFGVEKDTFRFR